MQAFARTTLAAVLAVVATGGILAPGLHAQAVPQTASSPQQGISVVGTGIVTAKPDVAVVTLGVEVMNQSLSTATQDASTRMAAVVNKLKSDGIQDQDIQTVDYSITPVYNNPQNGGQVQLQGYQVQNIVSARDTNVQNLGTLVDHAVAAGATRIMGIQFQASDPSSLKAQARDAAMKDAQAKGQQLATDAGVSLGAPVLVEESDTGGVTPISRQAAPAAALGAAPTTPVQPGQLQVETTVHVVWSIK